MLKRTISLPKLKNGKSTVNFDIFTSLPGYLIWRFRQFVAFMVNTIDVIVGISSIIKKRLVSRMFWGRGGLYRSAFHIAAFSITLLLLISGILTRFGADTAEAQSLIISYGQQTNTDLLEQGGSLSTILPITPDQPNYKISEHVVVAGETLDQIATKYAVSKDTVKWANDRILSPFNDNVPVGSKLFIPQINGVLYRVKAGDTLDKIVVTTSGDKFNIIELNDLEGPDYSLAGKEVVFVPNGRIAPPALPVPRAVVARTPTGDACFDTGIATLPIGILPAGTFGDPLCSASCQGYGYSAGFSSWHFGVDLTKSGGCAIRAAGAGRVVFSGWNSFGAGFSVIIDHGGGVTTQYQHGDGNLWVRVGDTVAKGQDIMYMGNTGNSFGTHLHLNMKYNGVSIDPFPYVPYRWSTR